MSPAGRPAIEPGASSTRSSAWYSNARRPRCCSSTPGTRASRATSPPGSGCTPRPDAAAVVATKIDKLARGERIRALRELESVFEHPVLPVSAVTGEGLDELWKLIDRLKKSEQTPDTPEAPAAAAAAGRRQGHRRRGRDAPPEK